MPREKPIGIDLGTTNSAMAWVDVSGRSQMLANAEGEFITPSIVFFSETEVVVGKNARSAIVAHPEMVAQWVKRDMGAPFYSHPIRGHYLPPEVIQACVLRKLKADVTRAHGADTRAVITVPAFFDEMRRKATADAGDMAGLRVLDIVNEPTAAALAFGEALGYLADSGLPREDMHVLVYDLGGGTFDATLLHLAMGDVKTIATDGDVQLGGHDWDQRLVEYAADAFMQAHRADPRQDPATLNRLYQEAMEAKHTLTARSRASIRVEYANQVMELPITREQFEEMSADLLERTAYTSRQLLGEAGMAWKDVKRILLVGGSSRMPMVSRMLKSLTGIEPDRTVNPDEAVARGAALYANYLLAKEEGTQRPLFRVTNVNAHSLGIEGIDTDTLRKKNVILIRRNTQLPARHTERFCTKSEGQRSIVLKVLEGESSLPGECIAIGRTVVRDLPTGLPKGWPIEVTFEYATNGRLTVHALVPGTHHQARLELERDAGLSGEGLARWRAPIAAAAGFNAFEMAVREALQAAVPADESGIGAAGAWSLPAEKETRYAKPPVSGTQTPAGNPTTVQGEVRSPAPFAGRHANLALPPTFSGPASPSPAAPASPTKTDLALPPTFAAPARPTERPLERPSPGTEGFVSAPQPPSELALPPGSEVALPPGMGASAAPAASRGAAMEPSSTSHSPAAPTSSGGNARFAWPAPLPDLASPAAGQGLAPQTASAPLSAPSPLSTPLPLSSTPGLPSTGQASAMAEVEAAVASAKKKHKREPLMPLWLQRVIGHTVAVALAVVGAFFIVWIMCKIRPDLFTFPF